MITLGIETSCDETALCLLETKDGEYRILANLINSQIDLHREYGGVFPMLAKREHLKNLPILYKKLMEESGIAESKIDRIAVTQGPGLEPALWTGIVFARELSVKLGIPLLPINHMEGHIVASLIPDTSLNREFKPLKTIAFPALALLISGGHTEIVKIKAIGEYEIVGQTRDDAVGEAFDKVARMLNLPYPGGPEISKLAEEARVKNIRTERDTEIKFPRPMMHSKDLNFSFSGLKTAVLYLLKKFENNITDDEKKKIAQEFEDAVTEVLVSKMIMALELHEAKNLILGGGVVANTHIRKAFENLALKYSIPLYLPSSGLSGDNALMIALAGSIDTIKPSDEGFTAKGNLSL